MSIYDQMTEPEGRTPFFKFDNPGDSIEGVIVDQRIVRAKVAGENDFPVLDVQRADGTVEPVAGGAVALYRQLYDLRPTNGDSIRITFTGLSGRTKLFQVDHARGQTAQPVAAAEPFPAVQQPMHQVLPQPVVTGQGFAPTAAPAQPWAQPTTLAAAPPWQPQQ